MTREPLNLELPQKKYLRLLATKSGDIILVICERVDDKLIEVENVTVPLNRRDIVANYFKP